MKLPNKVKDERGRSSDQVLPTRFAETPPMPSGDYSYTVEIVMKMQHSLGMLTEAVDTLKEKQKEQGAKLDRISHQIYAAIAILVIVGGILTFFAKSINDLIVQRLLSPQPTVTVPTTNLSVPQATPTRTP